jgi:hypothetical protein
MSHRLPSGQMSFEVYRRRGRGWQLLDIRRARDSRGAALMSGYAHNCRVLGVRPEYSGAKLFVYRFKHVPSLTSGG